MLKKTLLVTTWLLLSLIPAFSFAASNSEGIQIYQKNLHLSPEHRQKLADDITRYRNADNLWDVLRDEFSLSHYENNYAVQAKIEWYMNNQDFLLRSASRAAPYLYYISQQVRKRHLPAELVLLPIVESGYNPFSVSSVGASGIWQLMPDTASGLGVKRDWGYDGRRDVIASTDAALVYLAYLQSFFEGNWLLAIAAYNTGEGNVLAAIKRNIREGRDTDFWSLPVAQETRDYVPSLLALATIISHPDKYPVYFPPVRNAPYLAQIDVGTPINLKYAAKLAGISNHKLFQLNPGFNGPTTSKRGAYKLVLPIENVEQFTENFSRSPNNINRVINWLHYRAKIGDSLVSISKKFKTSIADIRHMNHLNYNTIKPGTNLLIPTTAKTNLDSDNFNDSDDLGDNAIEINKTEIAANTRNNNSNNKSDDFILANRLKPAERKSLTKTSLSLLNPKKSLAKNQQTILSNYTLQPGDTIYMVRSKDTIEKIAKHFRISAQSLRAANQLSTNKNKLKPGKQLLIPTHARALTQNNLSIEQASSENISPGDTLYMVRRGDTVEKIARKFKTTASAIRIANLIDSHSLTEGENIIIPAQIRG